MPELSKQKNYSAQIMPGVYVISVDTNDVDKFTNLIIQTVMDVEISLVLTFFTQLMAIDTINSKLTSYLPDAIVAGCTSSGSTTFNYGLIKKGAIAIVFAKLHFSVVGKVLENIDNFNIGCGSKAMSSLSQELQQITESDANNIFSISLIDGLSKCEESVVSNLKWIFPNIPLIGGSAGDDFFSRKLS